MSEPFEDTKKKITTWLMEEYPMADVEVKDNPKFLFQIKLTNKKGDYVAIPNHITLAKDLPDRLILEIYWQLDDGYIKSIAGLKEDSRKKFLKELRQGFLLMHLNLIIEPSPENIQRIKIQTLIILDGLNKHTLVDSLLRINARQGYVISLFDLIMDQDFDPYRPV